VENDLIFGAEVDDALAVRLDPRRAVRAEVLPVVVGVAIAVAGCGDESPTIGSIVSVTVNGQDWSDHIESSGGRTGCDVPSANIVKFDDLPSAATHVIEFTLDDIYPPMDAVTVPPAAPPMFVALAADDPLFGRAGYGLVDSWAQARRKVEFHLFQRGGHGFGSGAAGTTAAGWLEQFYRWLDMNGLLEPRG